MNFFVIISLMCLSLSAGAPQNLVVDSDSLVPVSEGLESQTELQTSQIVESYESTETPKLEEYLSTEPQLETKGPEYVTEELRTALVYEAKDTNETLLDTITEGMPETHESRPMNKQTVILKAGKHLSEAITAKIVGPIVIFNSKVAAAAGALPPMLAAKGAVIGSAIATPIEIGAVAGSAIVSGLTGKFVAVPISVAAGGIAQLAGAADSGEHIWNFGVEHKGEILKNGVIKMGHIILKPIAVVVGAQTTLNGVGLGLAGTGIKGVGVGMEAVGAKMVGTGLLAKGIGHRLIAAQFPPYWK